MASLLQTNSSPPARQHFPPPETNGSLPETNGSTKQQNPSLLKGSSSLPSTDASQPFQKKILITGGAGFVGSQLGHHLHTLGHTVTLMDNMAFGHLDNLIINGRTFGTLLVEDIRAPLSKLIKHFQGVDTIFHFAGIAALPVSQANPQLGYDVNVAGTGNILEAARRANVRRVVFASTSAIYENTKELTTSPPASHLSWDEKGGEVYACKEDDPVAPDLVYSMTKDAAEKLCQAYSNNYDLDIIIVRFFNIYGPHQDFKRLSPPFTSYLATTIAQAHTPTLFNSSTTALRDYVYSADLIALLVATFESRKRHTAEVFNACSGTGYSAPAIFEMMRKCSGKAIEPVWGDPEKFWEKYPELTQGERPLKPERVKKEVYKMSVGNPAKTEKEFGWRASTGMEEGLRNVYEYTVKNQGVP